MYQETLTFLRRHDEDESVSTYFFTPMHPVPFVAGYYTHLRLLNMPAGRGSVRELSFASAPGEPEVRFGVDGRSGSDFQKALKALVRGDTVEIFKMRGHMTWPPPVDDVVMIAGGVGVTPFRSMLVDARARGLAIRTTLVQVSSDSFLYADELRRLAHEHLTIGRSLIADTLTHLVAERPGAHYYLAGSSGFVTTIAQELSKKGITRIESDEFKGLESD
jgi:ferredoxin-NADP reductase